MEMSAFVPGEEGLAETECVDMASVDLNALEIEALQLLEKDDKIRIGIDSCAAVIVFPKTVADDYPMLQTPGKAKSYRPTPGKLLPDLGARKVQVKLKDGSLRYVNQRVADTHSALLAVSEMNDMGHDVFCSQERQRYQGVCVPRGQWHEAGLRESEWSVGAATRTCSMQSEYFEENSTSGTYSSLSALEQVEDMIVRIAKADHQH